MSDGTQGFNDALNAFLQAEADHGLGLGDLLPRGLYPLEVEKVQSADVTEDKTKDGVTREGGVRTRLQLRVLDGPFAERRAFVDMNLVNIFDASRRGDKFYNMSATFVKVLRVPMRNVDPTQFESRKKAALVAYNTEAWKGLKFMGEIGIESAEAQRRSADKRGAKADGAEDRNVLKGWHDWTTSEDKSYEKWKVDELPKQIERAKKGKAAATPGAAPAPTPSAVKF